MTLQDASLLRGRGQRPLGHGDRLTGSWPRHPLIRPRRPSSCATTRSGSSSVTRTGGVPQRAWAGTSSSGCAATAPCTSTAQQCLSGRWVPKPCSRAREVGRAVAAEVGAKERQRVSLVQGRCRKITSQEMMTSKNFLTEAPNVYPYAYAWQWYTNTV